MSENNYPSAPSPDDYSMKWHKFLIYFALWLSAVLNIVSAFGYFTGSAYNASGASASRVYSTFPGLKGVDIFMGICLLAIGVMALVTRFALAGYKQNGPKMLLILYGINLVVPVLYLILASTTTGLSIAQLTGTSTWTSLITSLVMIFANKVYYDKRAALFVN